MADSLPEEIITHVLTFLCVADRKEAALVCKLWYQASLHPILLKDTVVIFQAPQSARDLISQLGKRQTPHLILDQIDGSVQSTHIIEETCQSITENLQSLTLKGSNISEKLFMSLIKNCYALKSLDLSCCNSLFMSGQLFSHQSNVNDLRGVLTNVSYLNLSNIRYLSDAVLNNFLDICSNVKYLILSGNQILFHTDHYRGNMVKPSISVLTFKNIRSNIENKSKNFRGLAFSRTGIDDESLKSLGSIKNLELNEISLVCCRDISDEGIRELSKRQRNIENIDITQSAGISDDGLAFICENLMKLKVLKLSQCRLISDKSIQHLGKLKEISNIDISSCYTVTSKGLINGLVNHSISGALSNVSSLNVKGCSMVKDRFLVEACKYLPLLNHLDVGSCGVTDVGLYFICKYLKKLKYLGLSWCKEITDNGVLGRSLQVDLQQHFEHEDHGNCRCTKKQMGENVLNLPKIKDKQEDTFLTLLEEEDEGIYQISDLKNLSVLDLSACNKISDESINGLKMMDLKVINIGMCLKLTDASLLAISYNLSSIEELNLSQCSKITDDGMKTLSERCSRLAILDISNCDSLTDRTIELIIRNSRKLKRLDVSMCNGISAKMVDKCESKMPRLRVTKRMIGGGVMQNM